MQNDELVEFSTGCGVKTQELIPVSFRLAYAATDYRTEERFYERAVKKKLLPGRPPAMIWFLRS